MLHQKRVNEIFRKARYTMQELAHLSNTAPINQQIRRRSACMIWQFKQDYLADGSSYYVGKKRYEADMESITALERKVIQGGAYEVEALEAIKEAKEYLELVAGYRVRKIDKNRVY